MPRSQATGSRSAWDDKLPHNGCSLAHPRRTPQLRHRATVRRNLGFVLDERLGELLQRCT